MDTTQTKKPFSLEQILTSYNLLVLFFITFICLMIIMFQTNRKGFNIAFGKEIFVTAPMLLIFALLIKEIILFKENPQSSWFSQLPQSQERWFLPSILLGIVIVGIMAFSTMLYIGGIFSDNPPENNTAMIINFVIIVSFLMISIFLYLKSKAKDDAILNTLPKAIQDAFFLRTKYTLLLVAFVLMTTLLYFVNPWGIMTEYGGITVFFTLFVGIICAMLIIIYHKFLENPTNGEKIDGLPGILFFLLKGVYILGALAISGGLIYAALKTMGVFNQETDSWGHVFFNLILFCSMLGIIYKLANAGGYLDKNPLYRLILNTLLYIPCLLVSFINMITNLVTTGSGTAFSPPKPNEFKMLYLSLGLLVGYFSWVYAFSPYLKGKYLKQGGNQLVNQPIQTDKLTNVATYQDLSGDNTFDYRYAMSFWIYIDSFPPSTSSSYMKVVPLLSYGENPCVKYSSESNTLFITVKPNKENEEEERTTEEPTIGKNIADAIEKVKLMTFGDDIDAAGHRIIYKHPDVLLQKWNHIVLNHSGGTLDVFYNGKLVKSAIQVVPYMKMDMLTVGTEDGIKGNIANLMYFQEPLDILTINTLYTSLKDKNPPSIT